ncbi:MAG: dolichyl-phosphate-mannose--protein mannosyltransferase [Dermatophilaceae bacterium]
MTSTEQLRTRLLGFRPSDVLWGWAAPLIVAAIGGFLRFWQLGRPHQLIFDETYYVKQGYSLLEYGYERRVPTSIKSPDAMFTHGTPNVFGTEADLVVHPPVGKWVIAVGEHIFGATSSFGWRFSVALLGTISILMIGRAARRMFGSTLLGTIAAILLAFDGQHFVHSRTGLLDLIVMFWAFAAFCALLIDRDHSREVLARKMGAPMDVARHGGEADATARHTDMTFGPWLGWRPWRWVAGICLGLATGSKWSGLFFLVAFGLMTVFWDMGARRAAGVRRWWWGALVLDALYAALLTVSLTVGVYIASWGGWFASKNAYDRQWAVTHPATTFAWVPDSLRSLWQYHQEIYAFHINLTSDHPYKTNPWSWLVQGRPTSFFYEGPKKGHDGCMVDLCSKAITSIGTPTLWWGATIAIFVLLFMWALRRDWRAGAILAGFVGGYLPWFNYQYRTIFSFYEVAFVPFVVLAVTYVLGLGIGGPNASAGRRQIGLLAAGIFVVASVACFAFFYPIYTAQVIPQSQWQMRMWLPSWV